MQDFGVLNKRHGKSLSLLHMHSILYNVLFFINLFLY